MRLNLSLLFGIMGVLATQSKDPDGSDDLRQAYMDLNNANVEIDFLKLEVVRLQEELDECLQGHVCFRVRRKYHPSHSHDLDLLLSYFRT